MGQELIEPGLGDAAVEAIRSELAKGQTSKGRRATEKFVLAAISAIPWVGGVIAAAGQFPRDEASARADDLRTQWLEEHERKLRRLREDLDAISKRFDSFGPDVEARIQSPEYLAIVRQAFRVWDEAETEEKRQFVANMVANAAGTRDVSDYLLRLFVSWLREYHESHFAVIREIHQNPGSTRFDIWTGIYGDGELPREDSAEADLYRMLIRDLSTGGVIRQARDTNEAGQFLRRRAARRRGPTPRTMESSFDDEKQYVLTDLGARFVHYTLLGDIRRLENTNG